MMNYKMFKGVIENELSNFLNDDYKNMQVVIKPTLKVNAIRDSVMLRDTNTKVEMTVSPTLYVDEMFKIYEHCESLPQVMNIIAERIKEGMLIAPELVEKLNLENAKDRIIWQLINTDQNKELLANSPHRDINDLSVIYRVFVDEKDGIVASSIVTNKAADIMGVSEQELFELAAENTQRLYPVEICSLNDMMKEMIVTEGVPEEAVDEMLYDMPDNAGMYVISNSRHVNGAVSMLYIDKLDELAEKVGDDLYILPSSIHEVLAVSTNMGDPEMLAEMVYEVNSNCVALEDRLSNQVYHYDRAAKTLTPATDSPVKGIDDRATDRVAEQNMVYEAKSERR